MKRLNICYLEILLNPLAGLADDDNSIEEFDKEYDENVYRSIIKKYICKEYELLSETRKNKVKLALQYGLTKHDFDFERVFYSNLLPFDAPKNIRDFFEWTWSELFNKEDYLLTDLNLYKITEDVYEVIRQE